MEEEERKLDGTSSSMDKVSLNNMVVQMRPLAEKVKVRTIQHLAKKVKRKRKAKKLSEQQEAKEKRKAERLLQEIMVAKKIKPDRLSKYALENEITFEEFARKGSSSVELKVLTRMANHPLMKEKVTKWRNEHTDWRDLAAYLQTYTSRRIKKKKKPKEKTKPKENKEKSDIKELNVAKQLTDSSQALVSPSVAENSAKSSVSATCSSSSEKKLGSESTLGIKKSEDKSQKPKEEDSDNSATLTSSSESDGDHDSRNITANISGNPETFESHSKVVKQLNLSDLRTDADNFEIEEEGTVSSDDEKITFLFERDSKKMKESDNFFMGADDSEDDENDSKYSDTDFPGAKVGTRLSSDKESDLSDGEESDERETIRRKPGQKGNMDSLFMDSLSPAKKGKFGKQKQFSKQQEMWKSKSSPSRRNNQGRRDDKFSKHGKGVNKWKQNDKLSQRKKQTQHEQWSKRGNRSKGDQQWTKHGRGQFDTKPGQTQKDFDKTNTRKQEKEVLHPSWEASRRRQQQGAIKAFQGKKITFDD